jgi:hypothetical protein
MNAVCPSCGATVGEQIGGKLGLGLAAALFGNRVNPAIAILFGILGALAGHEYIDKRIRRCPRCGTILKIIGELPI